jgi:hypothetical protein
VKVSIDHQLDRDAMLLGRLQVLLNVAARVDDNRPAAYLVGYKVGSLREALQVVLLEDNCPSPPVPVREDHSILPVPGPASTLAKPSLSH